MKINKSLDIDLNIISPQKHIRIHEGDVDSVDILIGVSVDDETVDLDGVTIKYDATINNYLVEQDADGSVVDGKISIPVTQNMTAMPGLLLIDVRMIQSDQILFTQTICATVEKAVVNGSTYIDFDKITINQRMNALEKQMEHVEEIVENFDTSKLIVSVNRPPSGAPVDVDVDLLRVGDTWIYHGDEKIVYKLVEAAYHFRPHPTAEPYHKFTWQPLNERHIISNTEPPETVTYQAVDYSVDGVAWSWFPVQDYFQSDHYAQQITADESTYYICEDAVLNSYNTGICYYVWREEGDSGDISTKMDLAPINPTDEQLAAMSVGQLYGDTVNHKGIVKGGQEFYDAGFVDAALKKKQTKIIEDNNPIRRSNYDNLGAVNDVIVCNGVLHYLASIRNSTSQVSGRYVYYWKRHPIFFSDNSIDFPPSSQSFFNEGSTMRGVNSYYIGDHFMTRNGIFKCTNIDDRGGFVYYTWSPVDSYYTKTEIDQKGYLTLDTLPIYDGTVI